MDTGVTAVLGCVLFWLLNVAPPQVAFSGFTSPAPWFILGSLLIGLAVTQSGLAKRLGYAIISAAQGSLPHMLCIFAVMVYLLSFVLSATGQVALLAPLVLGLVTALGLSPQGNLAKGTFLLIAYIGGLYESSRTCKPGAERRLQLKNWSGRMPTLGRLRRWRRSGRRCGGQVNV